jgi:ketosteroid isomerase-like protein
VSTLATLTHHLQALGEDIESIISDYAESSVLFTPTGPVVGRDSIRSFFEGFLANSPPALIKAITITRQDVHGEIAYIVWKADPFITLATDTFVIRDGKIVAQTFAALMIPAVAQ